VTGKVGKRDDRRRPGSWVILELRKGARGIFLLAYQKAAGLQRQLMADRVSSPKFREPAFRKTSVYIKGRFVASSRMHTIGHFRTVAKSP